MATTKDDELTVLDFMPAPAPAEEITAHAGAPLDGQAPVASKDMIIEGLRTVYDPEIPINIYDLGLIYEIDISSDGALKVTMTLTTAGCPVAELMPQMIADAAASVVGVGEVEVHLVWDPPWNTDLMSEDAKLALGLF
jgi:FeS assembly SUF system protein